MLTLQSGCAECRFQLARIKATLNHYGLIKVLIILVSGALVIKFQEIVETLVFIKTVIRQMELMVMDL